MAEKVKSTSVHKHVLKTVRFTMWKGKRAAQILPKICGMTTVVNGHDLSKSNIFKKENIECSFSFEW